MLLSNGLGTNPHAWPSLLKPDCGVRVISWNHRGTGGSARPADDRVDLDAFVEDAVAVMDDAGVTTATVASWSAGVTVAFELAGRYPERVNGILAVAGVPGNTFATMLAPIKVPPFIAKKLMVGLARSGGLSGPVHRADHQAHPVDQRDGQHAALVAHHQPGCRSRRAAYAAPGVLHDASVLVRQARPRRLGAPAGVAVVDRRAGHVPRPASGTC